MKQFLIPSVFFGAFVIFLLPPPVHNFLGFGSSCGYNRSHNLFAGSRTYLDRLLYINHTYRPSSFFGRVTADIEFPPRGRHPLGIITYFEAIDQFRNGNGGCAQVRAGGVGHTYLRIRLTSGWNQGLDFIVSAYGR